MKPDDSRLSEEISLHQFLAILPRLILRSKTRFSSFLARSFRIPLAGSAPATAVFPIPLPYHGLFGKQGVPKLSAKKWKKLCFQRCLHVLVLTLNYIHFGFRQIDLSLLGRRPSKLHLAVFARLRSLLAACDRPDSHLMPPGRSGCEFIARLVELEKFAASEEVFNPDPYAGTADVTTKREVVGRISEEHRFVSEEPFSAVRPYRSLDASRLKLSGNGKWPLADFLEDVFWLPYLEPLILRHGMPVSWVGPDASKESKTENEKLCRLWDARGLLSLFPSAPDDGMFCRVFNAHKSASQDRQIGDRRWINGSEFHITGPSSELPSGPLIASIQCSRGNKLVGCASAR